MAPHPPHGPRARRTKSHSTTKDSSDCKVSTLTPLKMRSCRAPNMVSRCSNMPETGQLLSPSERNQARKLRKTRPAFSEFLADNLALRADETLGQLRNLGILLLERVETFAGDGRHVAVDLLVEHPVFIAARPDPPRVVVDHIGDDQRP